MAGRKIRDEKDARRCMAKAKAADLRYAVWAKLNGIDGHSLFAWAKNLEKDDQTRERKEHKRRPAEKATEKPLGEQTMVQLITSSPLSEARYAIRCGHDVVEVDSTFDGATLTRLLDVVSKC